MAGVAAAVPFVGASAPAGRSSAVHLVHRAAVPPGDFGHYWS